MSTIGGIGTEGCDEDTYSPVTTVTYMCLGLCG